MMRISGLATGMDTEKIIGDLMKAQRFPLDKITQKKQYLQWKLDDYRKVNRDLKVTSDKVFDTMIRNKDNLLSRSVTVSNSDAVGIKSAGAISDFSGTISVHQLATQGTLKSTGDVKLKDTTSEEKVTGSTKLGSLVGAGDGDGEILIKIKAPGSEKEFKFTNNDSISAVLNEINANSGVNAFYDTHTKMISMTAKNGGEELIEVSGEVASLLNINTTVTGGPEAKPGQNAIFTLNGLQTERDSNTFQINGFEFNLKQITTPLQAGTKIPELVGDSVTFHSSPNVDKVVDTVTQFVNDYNKMIEDLNAKIKEPKYRTFTPLSDDQKKDMKENEIKLWEEKAMSGSLRNDPDVAAMLTKLRTVMTSTVTGASGEISLSSIGITTSKSYLDNGKLTIDEKVLREKIIENPELVNELFAKKSSDAEGTKIADEGGLAQQFRSVVEGTRSLISDKAGNSSSVNDSFTLGRSMKDMNSQITKFEDRLKMVESRYWKQFNAMENAIQRANAQSASLMSALGGGN